MTAKLFSLRRPCPGCPFVRDSKVRYLGRRAEEIADDLRGGEKVFHCHQTVSWDDDTGEPNLQEASLCPGAVTLIRRDSVWMPQLVQLAERLGYYEPESLQGTEGVFETWDEFVEAHNDSR